MKCRLYFLLAIEKKKFINDNGLESVYDMSSKAASKFCAPKLAASEQTKWQNGLWNDRGLANGNKLRTYRNFKEHLVPESYLNINMPRYQRAAYVKLQCGVLPLEIETGRYSDTILIPVVAAFVLMSGDAIKGK